MKRKRNNKQRHRRRIHIEALERRDLLAVDGFTINLGGNGTIDLFDGNGGGSVQQGFQNQGFGVTIGTSNVPGQNNENPVAASDIFATNENSSESDLAALLLANDSDPDDSGTLSIVGIDTMGTRGNVTFDPTTQAVVYAPGGKFESLRDGETTTDTFRYILDDSANGRAVGVVTVTVTGANDTPTLSGTATVVVDEGSTATHVGTLDEPDANDNVMLTATKGTVVDAGDGTWNWSLDTVDDTAASETVTITAEDALGASSSFQFQLTVNNVAPTIELTGADSVDEGMSYELTLGSVTDPGDDTVTSYVIDWGDGSSETCPDAGAKTHIYADGEATRTITVSLVDEDGTHVAATKTITVNNIAPTVAANSGSVTVDEGQVAANTGTYVEHGDDTVILTASSGNLVDHSNGTWSWLLNTTDGPDESQTVTITATDSDGAATTTTFDLTVNNVTPTIDGDDATVAVDEGATAATGGSFSDSGADDVALTASIGTVIDNDDGTWSWTLDTTDGPVETQTVTITATDSDGAATSIDFDLTVNNVAPTLSIANASVTVDEGATATNSGTFSDVAADTVMLSASVGTATKGENGTWSWSLDTTDGTDESQTVTITAMDSDGAATQTTFGLIVNNVAPTAADQSLTALGNVPITLSLSDLLTGASDVGDDVISFTAIDDSETAGTLTIDTEAGTFTYITPLGFTGEDSFDFTIEDEDGATATATATITVDHAIWFVDNSAIHSGDGSLGSPFTSFTPLNDDGNDVDDPGDFIFVATGSADYNVTHGGVGHDTGFQLEDNQTLVGEGATGADLGAWLTAEAGISVPTGSAMLPAVGSDIDNGDGPTITNTTGDVLTLADENTINGVILDPVASAGIAGDGVEGLVVEFVIIITSGGTNDNEGIRLTEVTGTLTFTGVDIGSGDGGTNAGTAIQIDGGTAQLNFNDVDIDQSGGSLVSIINTFATTLSFDDNSQLTLSDSDDAAVTIQNNDGGTVAINNVSNTDEDVSVVFNISGNTGTQTETSVNDAPSFDVSSAAPEVLEDAAAQTIANFVTNVSAGPDDESDQTVTLHVVGNTNESMFASLPAMSNDGTLTYTLAANAVGTATISVEARDDGGTDDGGVDTSDVKTFTISVTPVNDAPSFSLAADPAPVKEDAGAQSIANFAHSFDAGPADESGQTPTYEIVGNTNTSLFAVAPAIGTNGTLTYTPAANLTGTATISVRVRDNGGTANGGVDLSAVKTFDIVISPEVNDAPSFGLAASASADVNGGARSIANFASNIVAGPTDEAGQTVTLHIVGNTNAAIFATAPAIASNGTLTFTPAAIGTVTITVEARDDGGAANGGVDTSATQQFTITINETNVAPELNSVGNKTINELNELTFTATASDVNDDDLTFSLKGDVPTGATITNVGAFSWTPSESQGGADYTFDVEVTDDEFIDKETITVTVNEVNAAPALGSIGDRSVTEEQALSFTATATDSDLPANDLTFSLGAGAPAGASITAAGVFTWTPTTEQRGQHDIEIIVTDNGTPQKQDSETITVTVNEFVPPPKIADVIIEIGTVEYGDDTLFVSFIEVESIDSRRGEATRIEYKGPTDATFFRSDEVYGHYSDGDIATSFAAMIAAADGTHSFKVDYNGDGSVVDMFTIDVDLSSFVIADFPAYPNISGPVGTTPDRTPIIAWDAIAGADSIYTFTMIENGPGVEDNTELFFEDLSGDRTFVEAYAAPTDEPLVGGVQANFIHNEYATPGSGDPAIDLTFHLNAISTTFFNISEVSTLVLAGDRTGLIGAGAPGGVEFDFEGVQRDATLYVDYVVPGTYDAWEVFFGGEARLQAAFEDIGAISQDNWQVWDTEFSDESGDVSFDDLELTFEYDESLLGAPWATTAQIEAAINIYQWDDGDEEWKPLQLVDRDTDNNQITVVADSLTTFVLGHGADAPPPSTDNADIEFGVIEFSEGGESELIAFIDVELTQPAVNGNSRVYAMPPGETEYVPVDGWFFANDHDGNSATPTINQGNYTIDFEQGDRTDAEFFAEIDGTWTVLIDLNGGPSLVEDANDIKFTFNVNGDNADAFPPMPTIISPSDGATIVPTDVELEWTNGPGSMSGVIVEVELANEDLNIFFEPTSITGQTAEFPELPEETAFDAVVINVIEDAGFVGSFNAVGGFATFDWLPNSGALASETAIEVTTGEDPLKDYEFELTFGQGTFDGDDFEVGFIDLTIGTDDVGNSTKVQLKMPGAGSFMTLDGGPWGDAYYDLFPAVGQTMTNFIQSFDGTYEGRVDYEGDGEYDAEFEFTLDFTGLTDAAFPAAPTGLTPVEGTVFAAGTRSVTLTWDALTEGDSLSTSVNVFHDELDLLDSCPFVEAEGPLSQTSQTFNGLPSDEDLAAIVIVANDRSDTADGDGDFSIGFMSIATSLFTIDSELIDIPAGDSSSSFAGGADVVGGVDYDFTGVASAAELNIDFYATQLYDAREHLLGTQQNDATWRDFASTHEDALQIWTPSLTDDNDDVAFNTIDLTLAYDDSLLGSPWLSKEQVESNLYAFQWDNTSNKWEHVPLLGRDAENDTITVRTDVMSPIVLGVDQNGPGTIAETLVEVDAAIIQATFGDEAELFVSLSIETGDDSRVDHNTVLHVTTPVDSSPRVFAGQGNLIWTEIDSNGQSLTDFIAALQGDYDFDYDFDGNGSIDEEITITLDTLGLSAADFPALLAPTFPAADAVLAANQREVEVQWSTTTADRVGVEVSIEPLDAYVFSAETEGDSITTSPLPTGLPLNLGLAAFHYRPNRTTQSEGFDRASFTFGVGTYAITSFEIEEHVKTVSPAEPSGAYGGGKSAVGGVDFDIENLAGPANFKAEYLVEKREWTYAAEGDFDVETKLRDQLSNTSHEYLQAWHVSLLDNSDAAVSFDHADLTLHYDESLVDNGVNTLDDVESHLQAYQYNDAAGTWQPLTTLARQPWDDRLTVRATSLDSPIVLGYDMSASQQPWVPAGQVGMSEMEIYRIEHPTNDTFYIGNVEFHATDNNVVQGTRITIDRPNGQTFVSTEEHGYAFISDQFTTLAELVASNHGTYTVKVDYENDGSVDSTFTVTYDIDGVVDATLPDAPTITAPTTTTTVAAGEPTTFAWDFEPDADGMYVVVHIENGAGIDDNEEVLDDNLTLAETTTTFDAHYLPTDKLLFGGVGATQTHHHLTSHTTATGTIATELELVTITTLNFSGSALHAAVAPGLEDDVLGADSTATLSSEVLAPIVTAAIDRYATLGLNDEQLDRLRSTSFVVANLSGRLLGLTQGSTITIDIDAAGHGWYMDDDPTTDAEFDLPSEEADPTNRVDLLTVVLHELGHVLDLDHAEDVDHIMSEFLHTGTRHNISDDLLELLSRP